MKLSIALLFSTLALALAQDDVAAHIQTMKEKMMEQRKDMFVGRQVWSNLRLRLLCLLLALRRLTSSIRCSLIVFF